MERSSESSSRAVMLNDDADTEKPLFHADTRHSGSGNDLPLRIAMDLGLEIASPVPFWRLGGLYYPHQTTTWIIDRSSFSHQGRL
jgi:hypothetical protein